MPDNRNQIYKLTEGDNRNSGLTIKSKSLCKMTDADCRGLTIKRKSNGAEEAADGVTQSGWGEEEG